MAKLKKHRNRTLPGRDSSVSARSFNMSRIRSKNTRAELMLRKAMWKNNIRFRLHARGIPGTPDIIILKYRLVIFVDGGFWHGFDWPNSRKKIRSNIDFWTAKIERNIERDAYVNQLLSDRGLTVMRFWDHEIFNQLPDCINQITLYIESCRTGLIPEKD